MRIKFTKLKEKAFELSTSLLSLLLILVVGFYFLSENGRINAFPTYLIALITLFCLFFSTTYRLLKGTDRWLLLVVICLICYLSLSTSWSSDVDSKNQLKQFGYVALISTFLVSFVLCVRKYPSFKNYFLAAILLCSSISAGLSIYLHFAFPDYQVMPDSRLYGFGRLRNPVIAAISYGFGLWVGVYLLMNSKRLGVRIIIEACLLLLFVSIVLTGTRSVWGALAVSLGIGIALKLKWKPWLVFCVVVISTGAAAFLSIELDELLKRGLSHRPEIWTEFISRTIEFRPFIGFGVGSSSEWITTTHTFRHPHSIFVSTFYHGGLIGLLLLLATYAACLRVISSASQHRDKQLALMSLVYGASMGFFDGDTIITKVDHLWWVFWFPVAWCLAIDSKRLSCDYRFLPVRTWMGKFARR